MMEPAEQQISKEEQVATHVADVRFEHKRDALGLGVSTPRLSWVIETAAPGWKQSAYEIEAVRVDGHISETGRVASDQSVLVDWPFEPLHSRERVEVRVRVWGNDEEVTAWSASYPVEIGLLNPGDWTAHFVTPDWAEDTSISQPSPLLRREFEVRPDITSARLYVTALGVYEAQINGETVGDHILDPGWSSYHHRLRYQTFEVTSMLREGPNAMGAILGDGWYRGRLGFGGGRRNIYGDQLALLAQLEITYADGTTERIISDETWRAATGPILASSIYDGETYDARHARSGWSTSGYDDSDWAGVRVLNHDLSTLVAPSGPPVRRTQEIAPVAITTSPSGCTLVDFGQNLVGWVRLAVQGRAGQTITLRHAEVLENGELGTRPLRMAEATDRYTLSGGEVETWEPCFTFHGFRYVEVEGWPGELHPDNLRAVICHSDMERTGWFECSDSLVNKLHENVVWGMRGNFLDVPTDCPQRDERLGWTGDIEVFSPTACFLYNTAGFLQSWLADLAAEQEAAGGAVPNIVPNVIEGMNSAAAAWGDAAAIVPWVLYQRYGDAGILAAQYESMSTWVNTIASLAGPTRLWDKGFQFGDWLDPSAPPDKPGDARTDKHLVATAYFARSAEIVGQAAEVLGKQEDATRYQDLAAEVRCAFAAEYLTPNGRLLSDATTGYALALQFSLLSDANQRKRASERLVELVRASGYHISTGFVGTPLICDALCSAGHTKGAYRLLLQRECPSWLYPVTMGATTIWERWDSMLPDGSVNPGEMTSFNHYALGAVADWLHRVVGGLARAAPGYRTMSIAPQPGGGLTHASARHRTPYGLAECSWQLDGNQITITAVVPPNTSATVTLPGSDQAPFEVGSGTHKWRYEYRDTSKPEAFTLNSKVGDLLDDSGAWDLITRIIDEVAPGLGFIKFGLMEQSDTPLRQALQGLPRGPQLEVALEQALAELP